MGGRGSASGVGASRAITSLGAAPTANYNLENKNAAFNSGAKAFDYEIKRVEQGIRKEVFAAKEAISEYRDKMKALRGNLKKYGETKEVKEVYKEAKTKEAAKIKKAIKRLQFIKKSNSIYDIEKVLNDKRLTSFNNPRK
jgi:vacuolar-type H+-ATPase subunit I/STV1